MAENILIVGCGYRGKRLGQRLVAGGHRVTGMTRSHAHAADIAALGITPLIADVTDPTSLADMPTDFSAIYHLMGSMSGNDEQLYTLHVLGTQNLLAALPKPSALKRYIYESSTAVYGQTDGELIDETAPRDPTSTIGKLRVEVEDLLLRLYADEDLPALILRPASIYRPEGVINKKIRDGTYIITSDPDKVMNHIYVEDFLDVLEAALTHGDPGNAYNVSDDLPKRSQDYFDAIADLMGVAHPRVDYAVPVDGCADLVRQSNKRITNAKLKHDFDLSLRFPTYRDGLADAARHGWSEREVVAAVM